LTVRLIDTGRRPQPNAVWFTLALLPYVGLRMLGGGNPMTGAIEQTFFRTVLLDSLFRIGLAPLAWWMGLRAMWIPITLVFWHIDNFHRILLVVVFASTATISF